MCSKCRLAPGAWSSPRDGSGPHPQAWCLRGSPPGPHLPGWGEYLGGNHWSGTPLSGRRRIQQPQQVRLPGLEVLVFMPSPALLSCFPLVYDDVRTVVTDFVHLSTDPRGSCSPVSSWSLLTAPKIVLGVYLRHWYIHSWQKTDQVTPLSNSPKGFCLGQSIPFFLFWWCSGS